MTPRRFSRRSLLTADVPRHPAAGECLVRVHRRMMACRVEVVLPGEYASDVTASAAALDEGDRLEEILTIFRESSELSRLNRDAHLAPVVVSEELFAVLLLAASFSDATGGAFDVTATPFSRCWGFLERDGRMPPADAIESARASVGMHLVELDPVARSIYFRRHGVTINLGSIGKGFVLDRMARTLMARGARQLLLSAGASSILARSSDGDDPWRVDLRTATTNAVLARLRLRSAAVGTSGAGEQFFEHEGVRYGHVMDPRTGWPAAGVLSASAITSSAASADALSTAFLIGGVELARRYCAQHDDVLAIVTPADGARRPLMFGSHSGARVDLL